MSLLQELLNSDGVYFLKMVFILIGLPVISAFVIAIIIGLWTGDIERVKK